MAEQKQHFEPDPALADKSAKEVGEMLEALVSQPAPFPDGSEAEQPTEEISAPTMVEGDVAPTTEAPVKEEAAPEEASPDAKFSELEMRLEEERLRREKLETQIAHERFLRDTAASRAGYYKEAARKFAMESRQVAPSEEPSFEDEQQAPEYQRFQQDIAALREDAVARSLEGAGQQFITDNPDAKDLISDMVPFVARAREEYASWLDSGDPKVVRQTSLLILKGAYLDAKAAKIGAARASLQEKRAQQFENLGKAKSAAAISGAGAAAPVRPKPKTTKELTADEANAALKRLTGSW